MSVAMPLSDTINPGALRRSPQGAKEFRQAKGCKSMRKRNPYVHGN